MPYTREQLEDRERLTLAPYAEKSVFLEPILSMKPPQKETDFQRNQIE
jgi:hypothetical protein